jgi:hypothetical protein
MSKIGPVIVASISGVIGFAAMATLGPSRFDYADAPEERQQKTLDNIAKGFEGGFNATSGGHAVIKRISANAQTDTISVDIQFKKQEVKYAGASAINEFRDFVYKHNCSFLNRKSVLQEGVTLKIRMTKPSGSALTNFTISEANCQPYLKAG